jgi:mannose-6-phosphate isomerase-like protein (cupin superfamily)
MSYLFNRSLYGKVSDPCMLSAQVNDSGRRAPLPLANAACGDGPWHSVQVVSFPPGSCEEAPPSQTIDTLHFTLAGQGRILHDGDACQIEAGVMTSVPAGTAYTIANTAATAPLVLFVAKVAVPEHALDYPPSYCHLVREMHPSDDFHPVFNGVQRIRPALATVHLRHACAGPWGKLFLVSIPPGCHVAPYIEPDQDQVFVAMRGTPTFFIPQGQRTATAPGPGETLWIAGNGRTYQSVFIPRGMSCGFMNQPDEKTPLFMTCLTVYRTPSEISKSSSSKIGNNNMKGKII